MVKRNRLIPEGETIFKIESTRWVKGGKPHYAVTMVTANGQRHIQNFYVITEDGIINTNAVIVLKLFIEAALHHTIDNVLDEIDNLAGDFIEGDVVHVNVNGRTVASINQYSYKHAYGFDD